MCDLHIKAVKRALPDAYVEPESPFSDRSTLGMCFFGYEKSCGRIFFGYISLAQRELVIMLVERTSVDPQVHAGDFQSFAKGLKRL